MIAAERSASIDAADEDHAMTKRLAATFAAVLAGMITFGGAALAQGRGGHAGHGAAPASPQDSAATTAFKAANAKMHKDMGIAFTGDVGADFGGGMNPHHQGAIDMAKVMLAHGKDPALKALAASIVTDQEKEIATMRAG